MAEDLSLNNNKLSFYVDKLGYYVLTNNKIEDKYIEIDDSMMGENTKLNKESNYNKVIIPIVIVVILLTLVIIGYRYKRNKK